METYYQILEIEEKAEQQTVKKAYFKAIRKYPPDKEPERFQKIREAYEVLMDEEKRAEYDKQFDMDPAFRSAFCHAQELKQQGDYEEAIQCCNEVLHIAEEEEFLLLLGNLYYENDNAGKELKVFEKLVKKYPEKKDYQVYLARAYQHRTWWKKSLQILEQLQDENYQSLLFFDVYGEILKENEFFKNASVVYEKGKIYFEQSGQVEKHLQMYSVMQAEHIACELNREDHCIDSEKLCSFIENYIHFLQEQDENLYDLREGLFITAAVLQDEQYPQLRPYLNQICELAQKTAERGELEPEYRFTLNLAGDNLEVERISKDDKILPEIRKDIDQLYQFHRSIAAMKVMMESMLGQGDFFGGVESNLDEMEEYSEYQMMVLDLKLTILDYWNQAKEQMARVKEQYPVLQEILGDFVNDVLKESNSRQYLWNKYEKIFKKLNHVPASAQLVRADQDERFFDSVEEGKIGRAHV